MGQTSFRLAPDLTPDEVRAVHRATLCGGYDYAPVPTQATLTDGVLTLTRDAEESGFLSCPWPDGKGGESVLLTATLRERPEPYHLVLELARGRVNQIRSQVADWQHMGFELHPADLRALRGLLKRFSQAAVDSAVTAAACRGVIAEADQLADKFAEQFALQLIETRKTNRGPLNTKLGIRLAQLPSAITRSAITSGFNALRLVPNWRTIEPTEAAYDWTKFDALVNWACNSGLDVSIGPVIDLAGVGFPDWIHQWDGDLPNIAAFFCDFIEQMIGRYGAKVRTWQIITGFNHADHFGLCEDDRLRLAARLLGCARDHAKDAAIVLGLTQPWSDYLVGEDYTYSPLLFADTLIRHGYTFAAVELEILHAVPGQHQRRVSVARDALSVYRLTELFSILSLPLELTFGQPLTGEVVGPELEPAIALALSLQRIDAVYWEAWTDHDLLRTPGAALSQTTPRAQALKKFLRDFRVKHLA